MKKPLTLIALLFAIVFVVLAVYYWITPASSLLAFMPGYEAASTHIHFKHGLASLILALGLGVYVWFTSAPKTALPNSGN